MNKNPATERGYLLVACLVVLFLIVIVALPLVAIFMTATPLMPTATPQAPTIMPLAIDETGQVGAPVPDTPWIGYIGDALSRPISGARVTMGTEIIDGARSVVTDDRGRFLLLLPPSEFPLVTIEAAGYYQMVTELDEGEGSTYTLFRGGVLEGHVRGHIFVLKGEELVEPKPIPAARLEVAGVDGWFAVVTADEEGRYEVTVPPGKVVVTARSPLHADARFVDLEVQREEVLGRDFILAAGVILDGFVIGDGVTLQGARVRVFNDIRDEADAIAGEQGKMRIEGLDSGLARVHIVHPGYQEMLWEIIIPSDRIGIRRPFALLRSQPFQLNVLDSNGRTFPDARIRIRRAGITIVDTVASDQEGLGVLASGKTYHIEARHHQFIDGVPVQFPPRVFRYTMPEKGPGELTIELRRGGRITGVVMSPNGSPVAGASVLVRAREVDRDEAAPPRILKTNRAGVFRSEPFSVGKWGLTISHPQLGTITTETIVAEGKTQSLGRLLFPRR